MSPEELKSKAKVYDRSSQELRGILTNIGNIQDELRSEWEGLAFIKFDEQYDQLAPKVKEFSILMEKIHEQLTKTAQAVQDQDVALSRNFGLS